MEYVLDHFIQEVLREIASGKLLLLESHALMKAQAKDYIREIQARLILGPVAVAIILFEYGKSLLDVVFVP
jgi:hypothetical protein